MWQSGTLGARTAAPRTYPALRETFARPRRSWRVGPLVWGGGSVDPSKVERDELRVIASCHEAMARYNSPADSCSTSLLIWGGGGALLLASIIVGQIFGRRANWQVVLVVAFGIFIGAAWLFQAAASFLGTLRGKRQAAARLVAACTHGIRGAVAEPTLCRECVREREERNRQAKVAAEQARLVAEQEAARKERERQERHRKFVRKIRLPEHLRSMHPGDFEHLVCDLFQRQGYEAKPTPISGDGGVDGYLRKGGALAILQCKRVKGSVGEPVLRDLFGTMHSCGAAEGIVVTTGKVSTQARAWVSSKPIRIIELEELTTLIRRHYKEDEVVPEEFQPKATPPDLCPTCGKRLRTINGRRGKFVGCTGYPTCRYTRPLGKTQHRRHWVDHLSS